MTDTPATKIERAEAYCSFCGKDKQKVNKLIDGPTVSICDKCIELLMDMIKEPERTEIWKVVVAAMGAGAGLLTAGAVLAKLI